MKRLLSLLTLVTLIPASQAATNTASSAAYADVVSAVAAASDGDTILLPNGSNVWAYSIATTKQIIIRAENITPTSQPTSNTVRNVIIKYTGASNHCFSFTSGNSYHCGLAGIQFYPPVVAEQGASNDIWGYVHFGGSGSKVPLLWDCYFIGNDREQVTAGEAAFLSIDSLGAVVWNCLFDGSRVPDNTSIAVKGMGGAGIHISSPRAWATASTMGTLDTGGSVNIYFEDCRWFIWGQSDVDDNGRMVVRHCEMNGSGWQTHGFSSAYGGRHCESYNNNLINTVMDRNNNRSFWLRAGTALFTDNYVSDENTGYGNYQQLDIGDNSSPPGGYPLERGPGRGHNGSAHVADPIYIWNNTGGSAYQWGVEASWDSHVDLNRDIYVNSGAKPDYTKYTYPHPLRTDVTDTNAPVISQLTTNATATNCTVTFSTDEGAYAGLAWGSDTNYGSTVTNTSPVSSHSLVATNLAASTLYHWKVWATDSATNATQSADYTFTTTAAAGTAAPRNLRVTGTLRVGTIRGN